MPLRASALALLCLAACGGDPAPTSSIAGRVVFTDASPAVGVLVTLAGPTSAAVVTDATGAYGFTALAHGDYTVLATAPSTVEHTVFGSAAVSASNVSVGDLVFTALGSIRGTATLGSATGTWRWPDTNRLVSAV